MRAYYQQAIRLATYELNALIDGLIEGATEVYAWPGHGDFPGGIDYELIHPECKLVMHAGDEAKALVPEIEEATVKWGLGEKERLGALTLRQAGSLSPKKAKRLVEKTARRAMQKLGDIKPLKIKTAFILKIEYVEPKHSEGIAQAQGVTRIDESIITKKCYSLKDKVF